MKMKQFWGVVTASVMLAGMTAVPVSAADTESNILTETENNNTISAANELPANTSIQGALENRSDKDCYKLELKESGKLSMKFSIPEAVTNLTAYKFWYVSLCDGDGNVIRKHTINGSAATFYLYPTGLNAGTYYITVTCDDYSSVPYTLTAGFEADANWETEGNNSLSVADTLPVNTDFGGCLHNSSDEDYYQFVLEEDAAVDIVFKLDDIITDYTSYTYFVITLYSDDGSAAAIKTCTANGALMTYRYNTVGLEAGTYYIKITSDDYSSQNYSLNVQTTTNANWESEDNNTLKTADELPLNTAFNGSIQNSSDVDYYTFTTDDHYALEMDFSIPEPITDETYYNYWTIDLCSADGNVVRTFTINGSKTSYNLTTMGFDEGTFYLRVEMDERHSSSPYTLSVNADNSTNWEGEFNNTMSAADELAVNTAICGRIHESKGKDYYKVTLDKAGILTASFVIEPDSTNTGEYWRMTLMDENGTSLLTKQITGENATATLPEYEAEAGTYYILIENDSYYWWSTKYILTANYEEKAYVPGDVNEDGKLDASDAAQILVAAAKIGTGAESGLTEAQELTANVNGDAAIDATDAAAILAYAAAIGSGNEDAKLEDFI